MLEREQSQYLEARANTDPVDLIGDLDLLFTSDLLVVCGDTLEITEGSILLTGASCAGKTSFGQYLARQRDDAFLVRQDTSTLCFSTDAPSLVCGGFVNLLMVPRNYSHLEV